ncbi:Bug family tripartite tricarboxylate transporter substrate binding protein [Achromobacter aloeverae]
MKRILIAALVAFGLASGAQAGDKYPSHPITMVVPGPAGGAIDNVARIIAEGMAEKLGGNVLVLNADGAGGTLATNRVAHAAPDGYTLLFHHIGVATAPALYAKLPYDTLKDLAPIGLSTEVPMIVVGRKDLPPRNVKELIPYLKKQGSHIMLATAGPGNVSDLCGTLLMWKLGDTFTTIPYRGSPPALIDMMSGRVDLMCDQTSTAASQVKAGGVKPYGVASAARLPLLPDVPTLAEQGFDFQFSIWQGLYAPAKTPPDIIARLSAALRDVIQMDSIRKRLEVYGVTTVDPARATPQAHAAFLKQQLKKWADLYKETPKQ